MARRVKALSWTQVDAKISDLRKRGKHGYISVGGTTGALLLQVAAKPNPVEEPVLCWVLRYTAATPNPKTGKSPWRRDHGLGVKTVANGLKEARVKAQTILDKIKEGIDPIGQRVAAKSARKAAELSETSFERAARAYIEEQEGQDRWKKSKRGQTSAKQFRAHMETYAFPQIGSLRVGDIERGHVIKILKPIWNEKRETAQRVQRRIRTVLDWSAIQGFRKADTPNPAAWKGNLEHVFVSAAKTNKKRPHPALPHEHMPRFIRAIRSREGMAARALEFQILTSTRAGDVLHARWTEIDLPKKIWTIPPGSEREGVKTQGQHVVPLVEAAVALLKALPRMDGTDLIFPGPRTGNAMYSDSLKIVIEDIHDFEVRHGRPGFVDPNVLEENGLPAVATGHGTCRSTFINACAENMPGYREDVVNKCLAHKIKDEVLAAYLRSPLWAERKATMTWYANYIDGRSR